MREGFDRLLYDLHIGPARAEAEHAVDILEVLCAQLTKENCMRIVEHSDNRLDRLFKEENIVDTISVKRGTEHEPVLGEVQVYECDGDIGVVAPSGAWIKLDDTL